MDSILLFKGSKRDFDKLLDSKEIEDYTPFMELIRQYNITVRANDVNASQYIADGFGKERIENVVIYADDYASVTDHVISNFNNIVLLGHDIQNLYIQNPPKRVESSLRVQFEGIIEERYSHYKEIAKEEVIDLYNHMLASNVVGQQRAKKDVSIGLLKKNTLTNNSPLVMLFYGSSGVGKTELAKTMSEYFNGKLTRIQFSMMQTEEAYKYIFGDAHSKGSLAKDLLSRETNIVLIDEFDKVNSSLYNVFYQMFDEGELEDINYSVDVSNCVFILTTNFNNDKEMAEKLGLPIFSRIDLKIEFQNLTDSELLHIIDNIFENVISRLSEEEKNIIENSGLRETYRKHVGSFENIRMLKSFIEKDIFQIIFEELLRKNSSLT
ncbi:TPA: ATP-dependent Clp protease ATP-binding subunit [Streptococcus pyogenes]|uniref:AAA family ATPase n=1 Tax=Streptococcus pyogenes TaxID=1314 RepID=UPI000DA3AD3C|nr:AAA family ATPase [Streptococcus pyogenes]HER4812643.1 ATP-dependent Clp protease ATP-binding subunit [Streptococcus pyogenes NGAS075]MZX74505.1 AAA domain-containing protein [Streptococcus pyogenes]QQA63512.1 ATP-dependent Clp protease ATP-binding subunit [Streptococcus pyogenes]UEN81217.1 ATP-dependent Clp protease ATP-binding subunit [Streptococcus pyogenes]SRX89179.1 ATP/GTP-binding protein [Streptococcus pyogenes]